MDFAEPMRTSVLHKTKTHGSNPHNSYVNIACTLHTDARSAPHCVILALLCSMDQTDLGATDCTMKTQTEPQPMDMIGMNKTSMSENKTSATTKKLIKSSRHMCFDMLFLLSLFVWVLHQYCADQHIISYCISIS